MDIDSATPWWRDAVVYQVYPRSFAEAPAADGSHRGIGDLRGIIAQLDHLAWLGVDALWLSPIFRSPMADFGYDISDHCDVDPVFGELGDLDVLLTEAHARGIRVLLDFVPNHTSDQHPWFVDSRTGPTAEHADWYVWRDEPANNWRSALPPGAPAWTFDAGRSQYYLHCFLPEQPDLDWDVPAVEAAMHGVLRFWLDRGVDGFRMDVVHLIAKDVDHDDPPEAVAKGHDHVTYNDVPRVHDRLRAIRRVLDEYPGDRVSVGEVYLLDEERMAAYYGQDDELHLSFNFRFLWSPFAADAAARTHRPHRGHPRGARRVADVGAVEPRRPPPPHPLRRLRGRGPDGRRRCCSPCRAHRSSTRARSSACSTRSSRRSGSSIRADATAAGHRSRGPTRADHGWGAAPVAAVAARGRRRATWPRSAPTTASILHWYRRLLALRRATPALRRGYFALVDDRTPDVLAYTRTLDGQRWLVVLAFAAGDVQLPAAGRRRPGRGGTDAASTAWCSPPARWRWTNPRRCWSGSTSTDRPTSTSLDLGLGRQPVEAIAPAGLGVRPSAGGASINRRPPRPSKASPARPSTRRTMSSPSSSARQPRAQLGRRVAAQQGDEVGARRQQRRVDRSLRATSLTHADTSVTAGRR